MDCEAGFRDGELRRLRRVDKNRQAVKRLEKTRREGHPDPQQARLHGERVASLPHGHAAGEAQVPVKPCMQQHAAVGLDPQLGEALLRDGGAGLQPQIRRVGVRADDAEPRLHRITPTHTPGHDRAAITNDERLASGLEAPVGGLFEHADPAGALEAVHGLRDGVPGSGALFDVGQQVVGRWWDKLGHAHLFLRLLQASRPGRFRASNSGSTDSAIS